MKNLTKSNAIKIIVSCAEQYETHLLGKRILLAYCPRGSKGSIKYHMVGFSKENFKHFTGVKTKLSAEQFYDLALSHKLSQHDFSFTGNGNEMRKLDVLPLLPKLFSGNALRGDFNRSGIRIEADYFVGNIAKRIAVGFRCNKKYDIPVTLYNEDVRKLTTCTDKVIAIWQKSKEDTKFVNTYCAKEYDATILLSNWSSQEKKQELQPLS